MIFELSFECCGEHQQKLAFFIQNILQDKIVYTFVFEERCLRLWIDYSKLSSEELEKKVDELSKYIPQSLFVKEVHSCLIDEERKLEKLRVKEQSFAQFCPSCLQTQAGNQCEVCHSQIVASDFSEEMVQKLLDGEAIELESKSGTYILSTQNQNQDLVYCVDIQSVLEICNLTQKELYALMSFEKPIVRVKSNQENLYGIKSQELRLAYAPDIAMMELFEILKQKGVKFLFSAQSATQKFCLQKTQNHTKQYEVVVLENDGAVVLKSSEIDCKLKERFDCMGTLDKAFLSTIVLEHHLQNQNILNFYFSFKGKDCICLYNGQTQWFNAVSTINLPKDSDELFVRLKELEGGESLVQNYAKAYPDLMKIQDFSSLPQGFVGVWEIVSRILGFSDELLNLARANLHQRGVAIDYKFENDGLIAQKFDVLRCIRSGMSFKLAGVEEGIIALGYIESFSLFPSKMYLEIRKLIDIDGISLCGDLFANKMIGDFFYKNNRQTPIYRNQEFPLLYQK